MTNEVQIRISPLYVSCTGMLCITITAPKIGCYCYEVVGVNLDESLILRPIQ